MHSRFPLPLVSVISSIKFIVIRDSISPTAANRKAQGSMWRMASQLSEGMMSKSCVCKTGKPPAIPALGSCAPSRTKEPTVPTSIPLKMTIPATTTIAVRAAGTFLVIRGRIYMMLIVRATNPIINHSSLPDMNSFIKVPSSLAKIPPDPSVTNSLNIPSWARKITMASPLTKPIMTE